MSIDIHHWNRIFLKNPGYNDAQDYGVQILPVNPAGWYWKVMGVHHLTGAENRGNHHVYVDVLDEFGGRIRMARVQMFIPPYTTQHGIVDKPANEPGANFPMHHQGGGVLSMNEKAHATESVTGLGHGHPDEEDGNTWGHHSFYVVFQKYRDEPAEPGPPIEPEPEPPTEEPEPDLPPALDRAAIEARIIKAAQPLIIPLNKDAMFWKAAQANELGERLTREYDVNIPGTGSFRAQVYEKGTIYAKLGEWEDTRIIPREN